MSVGPCLSCSSVWLIRSTGLPHPFAAARHLSCYCPSPIVQSALQASRDCSSISWKTLHFPKLRSDTESSTIWNMLAHICFVISSTCVFQRLQSVRSLYHSDAVRLPRDADLQPFDFAALKPFSSDTSRQRWRLLLLLLVERF